MFSTQELLLIAGFAVAIVVLAVVASRMAGHSDDTLTELKAERETDPASAPRPVKPAKNKDRKRR